MMTYPSSHCLLYSSLPLSLGLFARSWQTLRHAYDLKADPLSLSGQLAVWECFTELIFSKDYSAMRNPATEGFVYEEFSPRPASFCPKLNYNHSIQESFAVFEQVNCSTQC
jgi:hypothetical protein